MSDENAIVEVVSSDGDKKVPIGVVSVNHALDMLSADGIDIRIPSAELNTRGPGRSLTALCVAVQCLAARPIAVGRFDHGPQTSDRLLSTAVATCDGKSTVRSKVEKVAASEVSVGSEATIETSPAITDAAAWCQQR